MKDKRVVKMCANNYPKDQHLSVINGNRVIYLVALFTVLVLSFALESIRPVHVLRLMVATVDEHVFRI